jgi:4-amino-4-deoxy-L-arabinose transferase-like glycosyltransferase
MTKIINFKFSILFFLILSSFIIRLIAVLIYGDVKIDNEWNVLLDHLYNHNMYAYHKFENELIPTSYMPPMYPFLLLFFKIISFEKVNILNIIFSFQVILSVISVYIFYKINEQFFSKNTSIINSFIFAFFPLSIYGVTQTSSITLQIFLSLLFLRYFFLVTSNSSNKNIIVFSIICGVSLLTRGEFFLIFILTLAYILFCKKISFTNIIKIFIISMIIISPYLVRNYINFGKIHIVNVTGYALWKGNNKDLLVEGFRNYDGSEADLLKREGLDLKFKNIPKNSSYEANKDKFFLENAMKNIFKQPSVYFALYIKKVFSFYFLDFDSSYKNYYNFMHIFPIILISILSIPGLIIFLRSRDFQKNYIIFYLILFISIFSFFFILPRYKLIILPMQIILSSFSIKFFVNKLTSTIKRILH